MRQHTTPCKTCPFRRSSTPGELGGSPTGTFVGQAYGAFWVPCHEAVDYDNPKWKEQYETPQCAGIAIYRANCHPEIGRPDVLLKLPEDKATVFASPDEFIAHHNDLPVTFVKEMLEDITPAMLCMAQMERTTSKFIKPEELK